MLNNFIYAQTKDLFLEKLNAGEVLDEAIVFIEDTKEIWNHGHYFDCSTVDLSHIETAIAQMGESIDKVPFEKGDAENSAILKGENNQAISEGGVALGKDNFVGLKGWYYKAIQFNTTSGITFLYLSKTQQVPVKVTQASDVEQEKDIDFTLISNDVVSVVNDSKYDNKYKISTNEISTYGRIGIKSVDSNTPFPFDGVKTDDELNNGIFDPEDYSIYCLSKPDVGIADMGQDSFVSGYKNKATNGKATSFGYENHAYGKFSFVEGRDNEAGYAAHAEGRETHATGDQSHSEGRNTWATGDVSHAEGSSSGAAGNYSHAEGGSTHAYGAASHSEGLGTKANTKASHAEGDGTSATGIGSHAEGVKTTTLKDAAHAEGAETSAEEWATHAEGYATKAVGYGSHTEGDHTIANNAYEHASGRYNKSTKSADKSQATRFSIGIGTSDTDRKNAHEIMQDGKHYIYGIGGYDGTNPNDSEDVATVITRVFATPDWNAKEGEAGYIENRTHFADTELAVEKQYIGMGYTIEGNNIFALKPFHAFHSLFFKFFVENINDNTTTVFEHMLRPQDYISPMPPYIGEYEYEYGKIIFNEDDYSVTITLDGLPYYKFYLEIYYVNSLKKMPSGFISDKGLLKTTYQSLSDAEKNQALSNLGIQDKIDKIDKLVNVTYSELKSLRNNSQLIPGQQYRITDYETTTSQAYTKSAAHQFDLIVTADDNKTLNEKARAIQHEGDTYFANSDLNAWEIWYCLDSDSERFTWALPESEEEYNYPHDTSYTKGFKGLVRAVELFGQTYYLSVGVRTEINSGPPVYVTLQENMTSLFIEDPSRFIDSLHPITVYFKTAGVIYRMIDEFGNDCPYDFKNIQFKHPNDATTYPDYYYTFSTVIDGVVTDHSMLQGYCLGNLMKEYVTSNKQTLNNNVFLNISSVSSCSYNSFGHGCYSNSFGNGCYSNSFGNNCYDNSFGVGCSYNSFETKCYDNFFGNSCYKNSFEKYCTNNSFGAYCNNNFFGTECGSNSFGNDCSNNFFKTRCHNNSFGEECNSNSFGENCYRNSFGNYSSRNSFENNCGYNSFGNSCYDNSFGHGCRYNSFRVSADKAVTLKDYVQYNHFDDGCSYNVIWNSDTTSSSIPLKNINVNRGISGTNSSYNMINIDVLNQDYELQVAKNSAGEIKIYCEADLIV